MMFGTYRFARGHPAPRKDRRRGGSYAIAVICATVFAASVALTIREAKRMAAMGAVPMPGGWSVSAVWVPLCGESWQQMAASFVGMWAVMMTAMMLPSLGPRLCLWRYRDCDSDTPDGPDARRPETQAVCLLAGYFLVWVAAGALVFAAGAAFMQIAMAVPALARVCPVVAGATVLLAGTMQFTAWRARELACLRSMQRRAGACAPNGRRMVRSTWTAARAGLRLGLHCVLCSAGPTTVLLVTGMMDLRAMALVAGATAIERLAPAGQGAARAIGATMLVSGGVMLIAALAS